MLDVTMTCSVWTLYVTSHHTNGTLTYRISSNDTPHLDGTLKNTVRKKIRHYRQFYTDKSDPIIFMSGVVNTSGLVYDDFVRLIFLYVYRESSELTGELPEESDQFRFLLTTCLTNLKESVGLILAKTTSSRVTIPIDLSTRSFIPLPRFFHSRRASLFLLLPYPYFLNTLSKWNMMCVHF